jgi:poly-beta-1,6 N-acetyl-D-glucosamine export porin PgaA
LLTSHERLNQAEHQLNAVRAEAPFNDDIQSAWAGLQVARDHPRAAFEEYSLISIDRPTSVDANVGRGRTLLSLNEFAQSKPILPPLLATYPDNKSVQNYAEDLENYGRPFYKIETIFGRGGAVNNGADSLVDAVIYSAPLTNLLNDHFRLLSHLVYASGDTSDGVTASRSRLGIGMDYRARDLNAQVEIDHTLNDPNTNGIALTLGWNISDAWNLQAAVDTNTINLPAAALLEDITAKEAKLNLTWIKNESRKVGGELSSMRFSDSNVRNMANIWWTERWISTPVFKFDTKLYLSTSTNSEPNRDYFNPLRDENLDLELKAEYLTWHRYRRSFKQRAIVDVGHYWQQGFGSGEAAGLRYEHEWKLENETEITYGVGRNFQPYDGVREYRKYIYLNLSGRIK